jgi:uncharacterized membrane-anchored protein|tara:strand:+ start:393 stop:602 length:210 start_codon:yes stop_codon:yes gene_type:complete
MFTIFYTLLTLLVFAVIILSFYFKLKNFKKNKQIDKKPTKRKWWHNILLVIIGAIFLFVGVMVVKLIFN